MGNIFGLFGLFGFNWFYWSVELCDHCVLTELEAILNKLSVLTRVSVCYIISKMLIKQNYENSIFLFSTLCVQICNYNFYRTETVFSSFFVQENGFDLSIRELYSLEQG